MKHLVKQFSFLALFASLGLVLTGCNGSTTNPDAVLPVGVEENLNVSLAADQLNVHGFVLTHAYQRANPEDFILFYSKPTLKLSTAGRIWGQAPCNIYDGQFQVTPRDPDMDLLTITGLMRTGTSCDPNTRNEEQMYLDGLTHAYKIEGDYYDGASSTIVIHTQSKSVSRLVFTRVVNGSTVPNGVAGEYLARVVTLNLCGGPLPPDVSCMPAFIPFNLKGLYAVSLYNGVIEIKTFCNKFSGTYTYNFLKPDSFLITGLKVDPNPVVDCRSALYDKEEEDILIRLVRNARQVSHQGDRLEITTSDHSSISLVPQLIVGPN